MFKKDVIKAGENILLCANENKTLSKYLYEGLYDKKKRLTKREYQKYIKKINKIKKGYPPQYIVGKVNFYGFDFKVKRKVLIPRFETEELIFHTLGYIKKIFSSSVSIVDIGTGSGAIAITLKKLLPDYRILATDISRHAIKLAKENARKLNVEVNFLKGDILKPLKGEKINIIISNPPYLLKSEKVDLKVSKYEPYLALYGGDDGLKVYSKIFKEIKEYLYFPYLIAFEISDLVAEEVFKMAKGLFPSATIEIKKDLGGFQRFIFIFEKED